MNIIEVNILNGQSQRSENARWRIEWRHLWRPFDLNGLARPYHSRTTTHNETPHAFEWHLQKSPSGSIELEIRHNARCYPGPDPGPQFIFSCSPQKFNFSTKINTDLNTDPPSKSKSCASVIVLWPKLSVDPGIDK